MNESVRHQSRWGCINCWEHNDVVLIGEPTTCKAPMIIRKLEAAGDWLRKTWRKIYERLPSWCWVDRCVECKTVRVPMQTLCVDCYHSEQWAEYNATIAEGLRGTGYLR